MKLSDMLKGPFPLCDIPIFMKKFCWGWGGGGGGGKSVSLTKCCVKLSRFEFVHHEAGKSDPIIFNVKSCALLLQAVLTSKHI